MVGPRRNNRITESATKESREARRKAKKAIQETNGKRQDKRRKRTRTENDEKERINEEKKKGKRKRKTARVSGRHYVDYLGLNGGDASLR